MSFDIHLMPSSDTPRGDEFNRKADAALARLGASRPNDEELRLANGMDVEFFCGAETSGEPGSAMMSVRGDLTDSHADALFAVADATSSFVLVDGEVAFRTPANVGVLDEGATDDDQPIRLEPVSDAKALLAALSGDFEAWSDFRDQVVSSYHPEPPAPDPKPQSFFSRLFGGGKS